MIKTRTWIILIGCILILSCVAIFYTTYMQESGSIAYIYQDGTCIYTIDLSKATERETIVITGANGTNTILIEDRQICISEATCPDQVCVSHGWLIHHASPIVCLPNKIVITLEKESNENEIDGVVK